jgi:hypothetical protein
LNVQIKIDHKDNQWHWFGVWHSSLRHTNRPHAARAFFASSSRQQRPRSRCASLAARRLRRLPN